ncbi:MAG: D-alanyl-D-alanine carboxypeptidase/D-alanyl-D-alanine-endopeptidase [Planctomycetes bacterium]|nr:D-alanyl-D-alanine carboxypeptidase/D-alanyl-D-alanine-endopeptidase [Planctomycetota bacterium]
MKVPIARLIIAFSLAFFFPATQAFPFSQSDIDNLIRKYELEKSNIAIKVVTLPTNKTVYERNADVQMVIASNTKLFSTAAALCQLGPDFKFTTSISYDGTIISNTLQGHLVVFSNGDPNISGRFYNNNPTAIFESWADKLSQSGIKEVKGNLVIDQSAFDRECIPPAWPQDQLSYWYCAPVSAVSFNDNCVDITVWSSPKTGRMRYAISPATKYVTVSFKTKLDKKLSANQLKFSRVAGTNRINISGRASPKELPIKESITVDNPGLFFGTVLRETLAKKGISVSGEILVTDEPYKPSLCARSRNGVPIISGQELGKPSGKLIKITATSTDLVQTMNVVNKRSQNFYAEQILKSMAHYYQGKGILAEGLKIIREFLSKEVGLDRNGFTISDASGLARENRFSVNQIITLLKYMHGHKHFTTFRDSLNYERWNFSDMESVWTKTGYIKDALALSGYIRRGNDDYYAFSVIINDFGDSGDEQNNRGLANAENFRTDFVRLLKK